MCAHSTTHTRARAHAYTHTTTRPSLQILCSRWNQVMHIKAPNTGTHKHALLKKDVFKVTGGNHIHGNFAGKTPIRAAALSKCHSTCTVLCTVRLVLFVRTKSDLTCSFVFNTATTQLRNQTEPKASSASVSRILRPLYWLVQLSCLTLFTCFFLSLQDESQQFAAARKAPT